MKDYLLSVVIPTRNRQLYAYESIMSVIKGTNEKTQVVVQDNSDDNSLQEKISRLQRVKYHYSPNLLTFSENFDIAISIADGRYVCVIGDDDGVLRNIEKVADFALSHGIDAVSQKNGVAYSWVNSKVKSIDGDGVNGYMRIFPVKNGYKKYSTSVELRRLLKDGCQHYTSRNMVKIYHGMIDKNILDEYREKYGIVIGGLSPDIFASTALSCYLKNVYVSQFPFTIMGACKASGTAAASNGKHTGRLENAPHFQGTKDYKWDPLVPRVYSVETIWADSSLHALRMMNEEKYINMFDRYALVTELYFANRSIRNLILKECKRVIVSFSYLKFFVYTFKGPVFRLARRAWNRIIHFGRVGKVYSDVKSIEDAMNIASDHVERKHIIYE